MACKESEADQKQKEVGKQDPFMLEMRKETGKSRAGAEHRTQQLLQADGAQAGESDGDRMPVKNGNARECEGEQQKIDADRDVVSAEIGSEAEGHVKGSHRLPRLPTLPLSPAKSGSGRNRRP